MKRPDVAAIKASVAAAKKDHGIYIKNAKAWAQFEEQQPEMTELLLAWVEHLEGEFRTIIHMGKTSYANPAAVSGSMAGVAEKALKGKE